jgi:hypothetical protein
MLSLIHETRESSRPTRPGEDRQIHELVLRFYAEGGASDPAGTLARAQRVAIGRGQSPTLWTPFVLFGARSVLDEAR